MIGIFVGPVVLAIAYTLLDDWVRSGPTPRAGEPVVALPKKFEQSAGHGS
jgi:hypothetical protein